MALIMRPKRRSRRSRQAGLTFLELLPGALTQLKADFEADRQAGVEAWRAARQKVLPTIKLALTA
jgi:hypothetical protein